VIDIREYKIKRGHNPNLNRILKDYFDVTGDIVKGFNFKVDGLGDVFIQKKGDSLLVETKPLSSIKGDYSVIKKWNSFLYEATGKTAKERKKEFSKLS
jgi:hypothetical protein